jgi:AraC-like DNA-binding protein
MKQILTLVLAITGFLFSPAAWGQDDDYQHQIDSLRKVIDAAEGKDKLKAYPQLLAQVRTYGDLDSQIALFEELEQEATRQKSVGWQTIAKVNILLVLRDHDQLDEFHRRIPEYLAFFEREKDWQAYCTSYSAWVLSYLEHAKNDMALRKASEMYEFAKRNNHNFGMASAALSMGQAYEQENRLREAQEQYEKCIGLLKKEENVTTQMLQAYARLSQVLQFQLLFDEELVLLAEYGKAIDSFEKLHNIVSPNDRQDLTTCYANMYIEKGDFEKADSCCTILEERSPVNYRNVGFLRARILAHQNKFPQALESINKSLEADDGRQSPRVVGMMRIKAEILAEMNLGMEAYAVCDSAYQMADSIRTKDFNAQLDELRTQYEVDRHIAEKETQRTYFLFALGGVALLLILVIVILINRQKIHRKNKTMVLQIKELQEFQQTKENELLQKTTFQTPETDAADLCPESRKDKLCLKLRDWLLKDKIYRDASLSRDRLTEQLGINRHELEDAFLFCFGMHYGDYINELRLNDAVFMLEQSDLSIVEISEKTGFGTLRTFRRQFIAKYNMPPKNYQQLVRKK